MRRQRARKGRACGKEKSLRNVLLLSLAVRFGIYSSLHAPFNASAVIKSLIKLMSNLPREPGVGERYDCRQHQPSASNTLVSQPIGRSQDRGSVCGERSKDTTNNNNNYQIFVMQDKCIEGTK